MKLSIPKAFPRRPAGPITQAALKYAKGIDSGRTAVSPQVKWECARFLRRIAPKSGWKYDEDLVERIGKFCGLLPFPEGEWDPPSVVLLPWQKFLIANVYGWRDRDDGRFRAIRECMLAVPRKAGKSAFAAMLALADLTIMQRNNARIICAGPTERQARYPYEKALAIVQRDPNLRDRFSLRCSESQIRRGDGYLGSMTTTTGSAKTQDGENPSMVIYEETHAEANPSMLGIHRNSFGARRNPLLFMPTTAGDTPMSIGQDEREVYLRMMDTEEGVSTLFGMLYEADREDDPSDPAIWHKAQPSLGFTVQESAYRHLHDTSIGDTRKWGAFQTRQLNIWLGGDAKALVDMEDFKALPEVKHCWRKEPRMGKAWIGIDLSESKDLASITLLGEDAGGHLKAWWEVWVPGRAAKIAEERKLTRGVGGQARYGDWIGEGHLHCSEGATIRYDLLASAIKDMCARHNVAIIGSDIYAGVHKVAAALPARLASKISRLRKIATHYTAPTDEMLEMLKERSLAVRRNPVVDWCFANCVAERRQDGSILPKKITDGSPDKIDCVDSLIVAIAARTASQAPDGKVGGPVSIRESGALKQRIGFL